MLELNKIHCGDCLELMKEIPDKSIDLILCDLPYGITQNPDDKVINLNELWKHYKRILKKKGKVILTAQFPFSVDLINSNRSWFKYDLIWNKKLTSGFLNANRMPLRIHEHILVFYQKEGTYNPQKTIGKKSHGKGFMKSDKNRNYGKYGKVDNTEELGELKHPTSIITFMKPHPSKALHPTEKPVKLAEYLIKTFSNNEDLVLDNCIGVGWTAVACKQLGRNFIGIEINPEYCKIANKRLEQSTLSSKKLEARK